MAGSESPSQSSLHLEVEIKPRVASVNQDIPEKAEKAEHTASQNKPRMNRGLHPRTDPLAQDCPIPAQHEQQKEAWSKSSTFGAWEDGGEVDYTQFFGNVRNNNKNGGAVTPKPSDAPQNCNVSKPPAKEGCFKMPQFGAKEEEENSIYTAYFENAPENEDAGTVSEPMELLHNEDFNSRAQPPIAVETIDKIDNLQLRNENAGLASSVATSEALLTLQNPGGQWPIHHIEGHLQQRPLSGQESQTFERAAAIPAWGFRTTCYQDPDYISSASRHSSLNIQELKRRCSQEHTGELVNSGRISLLDQHFLAERFQALNKINDPHVYGGSRNLTSEQRGAREMILIN